MERKNQLDELMNLGSVDKCVDFILEKSTPIIKPADPLYDEVEKVFLESVLYYLLDNNELVKNTDTLLTLVKEGYAKDNNYSVEKIDSVLNDKFNKWIIKLDEKGEKSQNNIGVKRWNIFKIYTPLTQIGAITQVKDRIESIVNINQENER